MAYRRGWLTVVFTLVLLLPSHGAGQESVVMGLLTRAKNALNDLKYVEADSIARLVLGLGDLVPRADRIAALQIAAAARFPEEATAVRKPDSALAALRAIVGLGHTAPIPFDVGWVGLDSLYTLVGGSPQSRTSQPGVSAAAGAPGGATLEQTAQWLTERVPEFTGLSWRDSSEVSVSTASERIVGLDIRACAIKYRVQHQEDDLWLQERNRRSTAKWDSSYAFDARTLSATTLQSGSADVSIQLFGVLRGSTRAQVGFVRASERPVGKKPARSLNWTFQSLAQATRVRNALERLVALCQKDPF